ncbi:MAG: hypothetical protein NTV63_02490 [Candidatus Woesearchaeota archaeon]|nr:hypothetical protein [Candidatus Woesearchaeota archaeon]
MAESVALDPIAVIRYYSRKDIQEEMVINARDREVAVKYGESGFGKRPDILRYPDDIIELAKDGATSFHASEELWKNPLSLKAEEKRSEIEQLRTGWDLVLDIDCHFFEYSKIAAKLVIEALRYHGIKSISVKFSGNKGFHIGVPFQAFPDKIGDKESRLLFPEGARKIAFYLKEMIKNPLSREIMALEKNNFSAIVEKTGKDSKEITRFVTNEFSENIPELNAEPFLDIDTILISSRHLYRMPYSFNEKSGLISVPIPLDSISSFKREDAKPELVKVVEERFLDRNKAIPGEAKKLIVQAFDFSSKVEYDSREKEEAANSGKRKMEAPTSAIPESFFPPCIKKILEGLTDGRKRAIFTLVNFLSSVGWNYDEIESRLALWNKKNSEPLRENYLVGQIRYHRQMKKNVLPPNCANKMYYSEIGVCAPDSLCGKIKNPANYAIIRFRGQAQLEEKKKPRAKKPKANAKKREKEN